MKYKPKLEVEIKTTYITIPVAKYVLADGLTISHKIMDLAKLVSPNSVYKKFPLSRHEAHDITENMLAVWIMVKDEFFVVNVEHTIDGLDQMLSLVFDSVEIASA